jgi:transposase
MAESTLNDAPQPQDAEATSESTKATEAEPTANGAHLPELASAANETVQEQEKQWPADARSGEVHFAELNRPSIARLQKGMEIEHELVPSQKDSVRALRKFTTLTNAEIFRRVGVSNSNGYRYLRNEPEKDTDEKTKPGRGRKRKLDETVVKQVIQDIEKQPVGEKTKSWEELCKGAGVDVTPITLKRAVENAGYYKCPACQRGKICIFRSHRQWQYSHIKWQSVKCMAWGKTPDIPLAFSMTIAALLLTTIDLRENIAKARFWMRGSLSPTPQSILHGDWPRNTLKLCNHRSSTT